MKKYFMGIIALTFAIFFSAYTTHKPTKDDLVYFEIINGEFDDLEGGVLTSTPFNCTGDDEMCAKGYNPQRSEVVTPNETGWTLLNEEASVDDFKERNIPE